MIEQISRVKTIIATPPRNKRLLFIHIPKTAGSSIVRALTDLYFPVLSPHKSNSFRVDPKATFNLSKLTDKDNLEVRESILLYVLSEKRSDFISGHHGFSPLAYEHFGKQYAFFTILREPIERFLSEYFYNRAKKSDHFSLDVGLDEYLETRQARHSAETYLRYLGAPKSGYAHNPDFSVEAAEENLEKIDILGFMDNMPGAIQKLESYTGRSLSLHHLNKNPSKSYKKRVSPPQLEKIKKMCEADIEIYNIALGLK